jgi:hypothetical protein
MQRYYFSIANQPPFNDIDGLELPDVAAVRAEAIGLARDLMRLSLHTRGGWSHGAIRVTDDDQRVVLNLPFAEAEYP